MRTLLIILTIVAASLGSPAVAWGLIRCGCAQPTLVGTPAAPACCPLGDAGAEPVALVPSIGGCSSHDDLPCGCGCQARSAPEQGHRPEPALPRGDAGPETLIPPAAPVRLAGWTASDAPGPARASDLSAPRRARPWAVWASVRTT